MNIAVDIIEPCGFPFGDAAFRRAGMDYLNNAKVTRHASWEKFRNANTNRLVLATTKSSRPYTTFQFGENDTLLLGRETAGVTDEVSLACNGMVCIPMHAGMRSLNVAVAGAMIIGEMLRQTSNTQSAQGGVTAWMT